MNKDKLIYKLDAHIGEKLNSYIDRLFDYYNKLSTNKIALYAEFVNKKKNVVVGEFNGNIITIDNNSKKEDVLNKIKNNF